MTPAPAALPPFDADQALRLARETFHIEVEALNGLAARVDGVFAQAVLMVLQARGRVVVMGMGKSGHVGRKIAATLASTGTPAFFVHPAEASHGDLRRRIEAGADLRSTTAAQVMHANPRRIAPDALAVDAAEMMEAHAITSVLVVDAAGALVGAVHIGDLMRAKVI